MRVNYNVFLLSPFSSLLSIKMFYLCHLESLSPGPVVQLDRTSDSGSESWGFESIRDHQKRLGFQGVSDI